MQYSYEFKARAVQKALNRGPDVSFNSVAYSCGIDYSTLRRWVTKFQDQPFGEENMTTEKTPRQWTPEQKLQAVIDCGSMDEEQISVYCREKGIFPHHVKLWRKEFTESSSKPASESRAQIKQLTDENKSLKKRLRVKEKALARTAALLVLKKKVDRIWEDEEGE